MFQLQVRKGSGHWWSLGTADTVDDVVLFARVQHAGRVYRVVNSAGEIVQQWTVKAR